jgi:hypothetical protein
MHRLMNYLAAYQTTPAWFTVGDVVDIARHTHTLLGGSPIAPDEDLIVEIPGGEQHRLQGENKLLSLTAQGFYQIHRTADTDATIVIATNIDSKESDFTALDPAAFVAAINSAQPPADTASADSVSGTGERTVLEQEQKQRLWWYLLLAALLILAIETLISNRISGQTRQL